MECTEMSGQLKENPENTKGSKSSLNKKQKKRKRKNKNKKLRQLALKDLKKKDVKFNYTMSTWAESFTQAATWQLKHQLAFWKAKAISLDYENKVLRDIIHKRYNEEPPPTVSEKPGTSVHESCPYESMDEIEECDDGNESSCSDLEASEELIQFLAANAKYKEDARLEREKLKAKYEEEEEVVEIDEMTPQEATDSRQENFKQLYGEKWQSISALETSVHLNFISECDKSKPIYWPNIPFNFNFS